jgi:hypothetical protein
MFEPGWLAGDGRRVSEGIPLDPPYWRREPITTGGCYPTDSAMSQQTTVS